MMAQGSSGAESEVIAVFKKAVWEVDQKKLDGLKPEDTIRSLGIDSVAMMEVIGYLEDELEIHLPDESLAGVQTVGDLARVVVEAKNTA
jgi:acyl carrier protein